MVRVNNVVMATFDLGVNWYLQFPFRLMGKILKVILDLLSNVVRDSLWCHKACQGHQHVEVQGQVHQ